MEKKTKDKSPVPPLNPEAAIHAITKDDLALSQRFTLEASGQNLESASHTKNSSFHQKPILQSVLRVGKDTHVP